MKVGEYVRTRWGCIAKFEGINEEFYEFDNIIMDESSAVREELFVDIVEKSSPNIIDLIEVGDYVNGSEVHTIYEPCEYRNEKEILCIGIGGFEGELCFSNKDIESIVTKESMERVTYYVK